MGVQWKCNGDITVIYIYIIIYIYISPFVSGLASEKQVARANGKTVNIMVY